MKPSFDGEEIIEDDAQEAQISTESETQPHTKKRPKLTIDVENNIVAEDSDEFERTSNPEEL